jgi:RNA polymerase sigma-70 factor, ECF subfamily
VTRASTGVRGDALLTRARDSVPVTNDSTTGPGGGSSGWLACDTAANLVREAQSGSPRDLDALLGAMRPVLFGYFCRRVDAAAADDLAQRALLILAREYRRIVPESAGQWVVTIARNVVRDEHRRSARAAERHAPAHEAQAVASPEVVGGRVEYDELAHAVIVAAHAACTASLRAVVLGIVSGLGVSEIARQEGVSEAAVRVRLTRARAVLRRELRRFRDETAPGASRSPPRRESPAHLLDG